MPRKNLMSWEGKPNFRWVKMYKGVRYRVSCEELRSPLYTEEGSRKLANEWWLKKQQSLDGPSPTRILLDAVERHYEQKKPQPLDGVENYVAEVLRRLREKGVELDDKRTAEAIIGVGPIDEESRRVAILSHVVGKLDTKQTTTRDATLKFWAEKFLENEARGMKPVSFTELRLLTEELVREIGEDKDVGSIDAAAVEEQYRRIRDSGISDGRKKKKWGFFRRLVRYLYEHDRCNLPKNLDSKSFTVRAKKVRKYDHARVREVLEKIPSRLKLYALLGLNTGMTNADVGRLRKDQIDFVGGTLTRKRGKTEAYDDVPTVTYKLWPETAELLRECWSDHEIFVLTSSRGTALVTSSYGEGTDTNKKDLIVRQWAKEKISIPLKAFRSISATALESHSHYGRYVSHFLGHSPRSVKDKHYAAPSQPLFDEIMIWLRTEVLG